MLKYKDHFEETKKYFRAFWEKEVLDRPLVAVTAPRDGVEFVYPAPYMSGAFDGDWKSAVAQTEKHMATMYYGGEALPTFECSFGPDQYGAFLGAVIHRNETGTSWVDPFVQSFEGCDLKIDKSPDGVFSRLLDLIQNVSGAARDKFLVNMIDTHSNLDALSAIRSPQNLCMDLILDEESVMRAVRQVRGTYREVVDSVIRAGNMLETGMVGWAPTYCEGKFAVVQCDFSCMISPDMFRKFALDAIAEEAEYLDHCLYHYDGKEALGHLDDVLAIQKIDAIQWVPGDGNPRSIEWMDLLHKIQNAGKGLWIYDWTVDEIKAHFKELKPEGLIFSVNAASQREADDLIEYLRRHM